MTYNDEIKRLLASLTQNEDLREYGTQFLMDCAEMPWENGKDAMLAYIDENGEELYNHARYFIKSDYLGVLGKDFRNVAVLDLLRVLGLYGESMSFEDILLTWNHFLSGMAFLWYVIFDCEVPQVLADDMDALEKYLKEND